MTVVRIKEDQSLLQASAAAMALLAAGFVQRTVLRDHEPRIVFVHP